ncbi:anthocyanidin 3-O-glucoside 6''-O-acyltransferase-like [Andrographis paniculata]|uniref:anthocyanidin 3-O-glucoside 6''-O-acyltransferase-like n=1 Tax=Andrographis paniculata TaxID=175694 RepID=UPI0021E87435|nr:anthocyanidin 3-O-glucoside 6''-O-acyltransferase-like [Andrographis paniculata]
MTRLLESCRIEPAPAPEEERFLPLTFFDIVWIPFHPIRRLLFFEIPDCSKKHFSETVVPKLKESLSVALKHYFPLAATLLFPLDGAAEFPVYRSAPGDSVHLTIVESAADFQDLVGNHPRDADLFYDFIPELPPVSDEPGFRLVKLLALKVTHFPGRGICIGVANHHSVGDASSIVAFIKSWASICKNGGDEELLISESESLPVLDRSLVKEPPGIKSHFWNIVKNFPIESSHFPLPTNRVRATYVLGQPEIKKLKSLLQPRMPPGLVHISSFVSAAALFWTCLQKSVVTAELEEDEDLDACFLFAVDGRARLDPPVPKNYFGNVLGTGLCTIKLRDVIGEEGFFMAAEAIATEIQCKVNAKGKLMADVMEWLPKVMAAVQKPIVSMSGSARVDLYEADFGWGKMRKMESLSIDGEKYAISICQAGGSGGGIELGVSLPKSAMDAFAAAVAEVLKD